MTIDRVNLALDMVWLALVYDLVRALVRLVLETVLKKSFKTKGGAYLERIASLIDIPIDLVLLLLSSASVIIKRGSITQAYIVCVLIVSFYRSFIKPHTNPNSDL